MLLPPHCLCALLLRPPVLAEVAAATIIAPVESPAMLTDAAAAAVLAPAALPGSRPCLHLLYTIFPRLAAFGSGAATSDSRARLTRLRMFL
eukprot:scaffold12130_cov56-Phaeocystis_antarctica.AAC.2